jgi:hypothetical protein
MSPAFDIPRLWPIVLGIAMAFGSVFLPWIIVGRSNGNQEPLTPADSWYLLIVASLVCCGVLIAGFVQWRQKPPVQPVIRQALVALTAMALFFTALVEIVAAVIPSIGSLLRVGHFSLTWSTGEGPWLASVGFPLATIGISLESIAGIPPRRARTAQYPRNNEARFPRRHNPSRLGLTASLQLLIAPNEEATKRHEEQPRESKALCLSLPSLR